MGPALLASASDVVLPPTFVLDFLYLGWPLGLAAGAALVAGAVAAYRRARARQRGRVFSALMAALVFAGGNLAIYLVWLNFLRVSPSERHYRQMQSAPTAESSAASP